MRAATDADADILARLHGAAFPEDPWERRALSRLLTLPTMHARLAEAGGKPAGFILALVVGGEAEILTLCVDPITRRRGVARTLLADLYAAARAARSSRIVLEVAADNDVARALYAAEGFTAVGRRPAYYRRPDAAAADALILARSLA
ncbi:MAG: ribosomal protein S18-alanine N-acetyltransferase [Alphaproteobacteria bacterium]|nr:ribosomal protein S18-alanine N-acetyltransferase [Alphaproteobacteria bacterium]MDE2513910.1 ribosomal protein S18-alanine N-acetyltransferase [Alphaproteobacteria bacterium]